MNRRFEEQADKVLDAFSGQWEQSPAYSTAMLEALSFSLGPGSEIIIAGSGGAADTQQMLKLARSKFMPNTIVLLHDQGNADASLYELIPFVKKQTVVEGKATAYLCQSYAGKKPVNTIGQFEQMLAAIGPKEMQRSK